MSGVALSIEARGFNKPRRVLDRLSHLDTRELMDNVGAVVENQVRRRIVRKEGPPDGGKWAEYSDSYKARKKKLGKIKFGFLRLYGDLVDSMTHNVLVDGVEIGSNRVYAATMQLGSRDGNTPPREHLGLSDDNQDEVERTINTWILETIGV
jgi:phage virion morphogenesis protein